MFEGASPEVILGIIKLFLDLGVSGALILVGWSIAKLVISTTETLVGNHLDHIYGEVKGINKSIESGLKEVRGILVAAILNKSGESGISESTEQD